MRQDTYGGKTPQETLDLFVEALRAEDIELASKYFIVGENDKIDEKWIEGLRKTKESGKLQKVANLLLKAKPDIKSRSSEKDFKFSTYEDGELKVYINLEFNEYSGVWKIESL